MPSTTQNNDNVISHDEFELLRLRRAIRNGTYRPNLGALADALLEEPTALTNDVDSPINAAPTLRAAT